MPWCPECKTEYRDGYSVCADCGKELINKLPQEEISDDYSEFNRIVVPCLLMTTSEQIQLSIIEDLLKKENILFYTQEKECGSYMKVYFGNSVFGTDVFVDENQYDIAKEIIDAYFINIEINNHNKAEDILHENDKSSFYARKTIMRIIIALMFLAPLALIIYIITFALLNNNPI